MPQWGLVEAQMDGIKSEQKKELASFLAGFAKNDVPLVKQLVMARKLLKKSQAQLSRDMDMTPGAVCRIENGSRKGTLETLQIYANALGLRIALVPKEPK